MSEMSRLFTAQCEFQRRVADALGLPVERLTRIGLDISAGEIPTIEVRIVVTDSQLNAIADAIIEYEFVRKRGSPRHGLSSYGESS